MILRAKPQGLVTTEGFADASSIPAWALDAVNKAAGIGLIKGYPDNTFRPDRPVARSEAAAIFFRAIHLP